jgi:hypothetical protein
MSPFPQLDVDKGCSLQAMYASALTWKNDNAFFIRIPYGVRQL